MEEVKAKACDIIAAGGMLTAGGRMMISELDKELCRRRISPGGAKDLTAARFFVYFLEQELGRQE